MFKQKQIGKVYYGYLLDGEETVRKLKLIKHSEDNPQLYIAKDLDRGLYCFVRGYHLFMKEEGAQLDIAQSKAQRRELLYNQIETMEEFYLLLVEMTYLAGEVGLTMRELILTKVEGLGVTEEE